MTRLRELLEDEILLARGDPNTRVLHQDTLGRAGGCHTHDDLPAGRGELRGVRDQVAKDLQDSIAVGDHSR